MRALGRPGALDTMPAFIAQEFCRSARRLADLQTENRGAIRRRRKAALGGSPLRTAAARPTAGSAAAAAASRSRRHITGAPALPSRPAAEPEHHVGHGPRAQRAAAFGGGGGGGAQSRLRHGPPLAPQPARRAPRRVPRADICRVESWARSASGRFAMIRSASERLGAHRNDSERSGALRNPIKPESAGPSRSSPPHPAHPNPTPSLLPRSLARSLAPTPACSQRITSPSV